MQTLGRIRATLDATVEMATAGKQVSCRAGCSACCRQLIYMTLPEAADIVSRYPDRIRAMRSLLAQQSRRLMIDADPMHYFWTPCPLLDGDLCSVYPHRPMTCRGHLAESDPALCSDGTARVVLHDMRQFVARAMTDTFGAAKQPHSILPIPMALLAAIDAYDAELSRVSRAAGDGG